MHPAIDLRNVYTISSQYDHDKMRQDVHWELNLDNPSLVISFNCKTVLVAKPWAKKTVWFSPSDSLLWVQRHSPLLKKKKHVVETETDTLTS